MEKKKGLKAATNEFRSAERISHEEHGDEKLEFMLSTSAIKDGEESHGANHADSVSRILLKVNDEMYPAMPNEKVEEILLLS